jgi:NADPH:quinone reductase-like Zn-dependent oxidoreductase
MSSTGPRLVDTTPAKRIGWLPCCWGETSYLGRAAGVGLAGISALDALAGLGIKGPEIVLVHGPVSGAGGFALQLAKARGAVVAALTLPEQADLAWKLGADVVVPAGANPKRAVESVRSLFGDGVDSAIHVAGNLAIAAEIVRPGGKFTSVSTATTSVRHVHSEFVRAVVAPMDTSWRICC